MNYPIPDNPQQIFAMRQQPVNEELVAVAIAGVIKLVRSQGQSLEELTSQLLAEDAVLDKQQRRWLSQVVAQAWESLA
ncbi:MAG: hypothetical protein HC836_10275 [Richelia sp. RM2_1_2]|uniref:Uncharacterized protein n=1 Tax=Plectonema cf. radiosum LEGE 06105 TaxID=945769 RepID=A0A8J7F4M4_9CYAN|nr:hypothetical protein [Plectonema radiosum]MEB3214716.1 hypothetical protein [Nostocales cyanobacterium 94392]NJM21164.1 hypothetical protein [Richelia sp. SM1_7_0]NJN08037.1 hypothetical protein [Richelia sp. RM1_1_1]NJO27802.1 hypothetical protein [Richelia sp. SL_2_1]NJO58710.1 hypothetical protein [Richelia sp. RM2_1_2]